MFTKGGHGVLVVGKITFAAFLNYVLDGTVHQQVRVSSDWRGEMRIMFQRKSKVTDIFRPVYRLLHRPQHQSLYQVDIFAFFNRTG